MFTEPAPSRKEIRELSEIELNLFREGLAKFQNEKSVDDPKSWFQIAGESIIEIVLETLVTDIVKASMDCRIQLGPTRIGMMIFLINPARNGTMVSAPTVRSSF
jgi:hypothetical protein